MNKSLLKNYHVLTRSEVEERLKISRSKLYASMDPTSKRYNAAFPIPIRNGRSIGFLAHEIDAFVESLMRARKPARENDKFPAAAAPFKPNFPNAAYENNSGFYRDAGGMNVVNKVS